MTPNPKLTDGLPDWCAGSHTQARFAREDDTGLCDRCGRRVRTLSNGHLRRHRVKVDEMVRQRRA